MASRGRRGYYSSFQYVTLTAGQLIALGVLIVLQQVLSAQALATWGWRIPFVIGAAGAVGVLWLRRSMDESTQFDQAKQQSSSKELGSVRALAAHPRAVLTVVGLTLGGTVAFYTYTTYLQKFMVNTSGIAKGTVSWINFAALLAFVLLQPLAGALSDRVGRRPLLLGFGVAGTLFTVPLLTVLSNTSNPYAAFGLMLFALVMVTGYTSINAVVKAELFPTSIRALGVGLPYGVTVAVFGGTAEYVALWLKKADHETLFYYYVAGCILVSLLVYVTMVETSSNSALDRHTGKREDRKAAVLGR